MESNNIQLPEKDFQCFGGSLLMFIFTCAFGHLMDIPKELKNKIEEIKNKGSDLKEKDLDEIMPLINDYYHKVKKES